ncbi:MAG: hemolysin family protein [Candidatus Neomarinimicrobiota bacterium]|nr:hemolysin family protein [Candidatus Neomarinimicrobiota bacterium]
MIESAIALFGLVLSAFFSGTEIAFLQANPVQLAVWREGGNKTAHRTEMLLAEPDRYLTTVLVGTNLTNVLTSSYATIVLSRMGLPEMFIILILGSVILLFGEVLPKIFARDNASSMAVLATPFLKSSELLLAPLIWLARAYASRFPNGDDDKRRSADFLARDELRILFGEAYVGEDLEAEEKKVITNIFEFGSQPVKAAMTPRADIIGIDESASIDDTMKLMESTGLSKLVLFNDSLDNIRGIVFLHDLISGGGKLANLARRPLFISESMTASEALSELRGYRSTIAMVVALDGKTSGLVTVEDLIEELFGEFEDVFDEETNRVSRLSDDSLLMDGRMSLDELVTGYGIQLPSGSYETVGGFVIDRLGRIPSSGEILESDDVSIRILRSTPSQVERIHLRKRRP